jgi:hypothetical protein
MANWSIDRGKGAFPSNGQRLALLIFALSMSPASGNGSFAMMAAMLPRVRRGPRLPPVSKPKPWRTGSMRW